MQEDGIRYRNFDILLTNVSCNEKSSFFLRNPTVNAEINTN